MTRSAAICTALLVLAGCTRDFGAFDFEAGGEGGRDELSSPAEREDAGGGGGDSGPAADGSGHGATDTGGPGAPASDAAAGSDAPPPDGMETAAPDAGFAGATDASEPSAPDAGERDAATDAGTIDAGGDAGVISPACVTAWNTAPPAGESCRDCACGACTEPLLTCLAQGNPAKRAQCQSVLTCMLEQACGDACYCATPQCGAPALDGDGPCAAQINAAAGGGRDAVNQILATNNPSEPLVRAKQAMDCVLGSDPGDPGACAGSCP